MKIRFSLRSSFVLPLLCALALLITYWVPRSQTLFHDDRQVGYYRGLGLTEGPGYFGRNWFRVVVREKEDDYLADYVLDGYWEVNIDGLGYNQYRGYYATGVLREEGLCMVVENGSEVRPLRNELKHGKFYDPDGNLISEVKDGTGKQILCFSNGQRYLEADLANGKWSGPLKMWYRNGQLRVKGHCHDGMGNGPAKTYFANGILQYEGEYKDDEKAGVWVHYAENGDIASKIDHGTPTGVEPEDAGEPGHAVGDG